MVTSHRAIGRRIVDKLYIEICLLADRRFERMTLWYWLAEYGLKPEELTLDQALDFLNVKGTGFLNQSIVVGRGRWNYTDMARIVQTLRKWNPEVETPEEAMARLIERASTL